MTKTPNPRVPSARVDAQFIDRWSPRSFAPEPLSAAEIASLFEAARWSPSSSNLQPWLFLYETDGPDRPLFDSILKPGNRVWASKAPLLAFLFARIRTEDGREPRTTQFDAGAAWMSLALQAHALGICTHAMAGHRRRRCAHEAGRRHRALRGDVRLRRRPDRPARGAAAGTAGARAATGRPQAARRHSPPRLPRETLIVGESTRGSGDGSLPLGEEPAKSPGRAHAGNGGIRGPGVLKAISVMALTLRFP